ncbi:MAG TPA: transcriptional regulator NrdR [Ktedonobacterales bacterium]|nr:transcriptional regulator NrdR [Ktedonobacterales bacterium]
MQCPHCGYVDSKVVDSRDNGETVQRRRRCERCHERFTTVERIVLNELMVVKRDGRREPFSREKLESGLRHACQKRPIAVGQLEAIVRDIENEIYKLGKAEIESSMIGEMAMERLRRIDAIAYIRFASVYRSYPNLSAMRQEMDRLLEDIAEEDATNSAGGNGASKTARSEKAAPRR